MPLKKVYINSEYIKLDSFLKYCSVVQTGGQAKFLIKDSKVCVNGIICTQRGKKLIDKDTVTVFNDTYEVCHIDNK